IPETMLPPDLVRNAAPDDKFPDGRKVFEVAEEEREMLAFLRRHMGSKPWLLAGAKLYDRKNRKEGRFSFFNSAVLYNNSDVETARYDKKYLVPGAEELPLIPEGALADWFRDALNPYTQGMVPEMEPGPGAVVFDFPSAGGATGGSMHKAGVAIC